MNHLVTEKVCCCVCDGTGKVPRLFFWTRDCHVCEGTGGRAIIMDNRFPEPVKEQIRFDAVYSLNTRAALSGRYGGPGNSLSNALFGGPLF